MLYYFNTLWYILCKAISFSVLQKLLLSANIASGDDKDFQVIVFLLAFSKLVKVSGQEYQLELIDTAGQVCILYMDWILIRDILLACWLYISNAIVLERVIFAIQENIVKILKILFCIG